MTTANITTGDDGTVCLEIWNGQRKLTAYVYKNGEVLDCLVVTEKGEINDVNLHWGLKYVQHDSQGETNAKD